MAKKPDDAAKIAGLASILQVSNKPKEAAAAAPSHPSPALPAPPPSEAPLPSPRRKQAERVGKYRDPNYHHYGVYLRKETHKQAKRRLEDSDSGQDVSELLQTLLEQWLAD